MSPRRLPLVALLLVCGAAAAVALWRAGTHAGDDAAARLAAGLRCPACQGETVAGSRSPVAEAMRAEIVRLLASGSTPGQVEDWFVRRYGPEVLADPSPAGAGALLWVLPGAVLAGVLVLAFRTVRRRPGTGARVADGVPWLRRYAWGVAAAALVALVCGVALAAGKLGGDTGPAAARPADPVAVQIAIGESLEGQGRFPAAAQAYQVALALRPDTAVRLRLAFAQLRAGQPAEAGRSAGQVLIERPGDENALLVLGLAQRAAHDPAARQTLDRFLTAAPGHPAAPDVRRLLAGAP